MQVIPIAGCDPITVVFVWLLFCCVFFAVFALLFLVWFLVCSRAGTVSGLRTGPEPALLRLSTHGQP